MASKPPAAAAPSQGQLAPEQDEGGSHRPILSASGPRSSARAGIGTSRCDVSAVAEVDALFAGRTRILISHRAATLAGCDLRVHLERGRLEVLPPAAVTVRS